MTRNLFLMCLVVGAGCSGESTTAADVETKHVLDPDTQITLPEGFDAELLYDVPKSQGSWVAMDFDAKGRLLVSDQDDKGIFRVTLPPVGAANSGPKVESLSGFPFVPVAWGKRTVAGALGFLYAFDSLYMSTMKGFYRIRDTNGDDQFDEFKLIKKLDPGWEHSAHTIIKTEDGKALYLVSGNHSSLPKGVKFLQPPVWQKDSLLPSMVDPSGHARGIKAPGGWICRISPDGEDWTIVASGFRNSVDLAINRAGELFTADSDLEFDVGSPWYRPTRVNHVTSASEFGWRTGSAKWPDYFADSLGSVVDLGPGSPTGISFGHHSKFPAVYHDKLFVCDWTFGTIYTVAMEEDGSSYVGTKEEFLSGTPLNISAMRFGPDGHMYFLTGGRNTDSKLYRVRYTGPEQNDGARVLDANQAQRDLRHELEAFHGSSNGGKAAVEKAWPHLGHADRSIRSAARLAIENQDLALWRDRVLAEDEPRGLIHGVIALCRHGDPGLGDRVLAKLRTIDFGKLGRLDQLALLRAYSLCLIRMETESVASSTAVAELLEPFYPAEDEALNTELCRLLCFLESESVVEKTLALMKVTQTKTLAYNKEMLGRHEYGKAILKTMANTPNSQNIQYAYSLRRVQKGWTLEDRKYFFGWLRETLLKSGGQSFDGYVRAIRQDAIDHLPQQDAAQVAWLLGDIKKTDLDELPVPKGPPVLWTVENATALFEGELTGRDFDNGKQMFAAGKCVVCHRFQGTGGFCGPDLGSIGSRFSVADIIKSICEPSQTISEQYQASVVTRQDGSLVFGRVIYKDEKELAIASDPYDFSDLTIVPNDDVKDIELSHVSMMPPGTILMMGEEELHDLMAYLLSGGDKRHAVFK